MCSSQMVPYCAPAFRAAQKTSISSPHATQRACACSRILDLGCAGNTLDALPLLHLASLRRVRNATLAPAPSPKRIVCASSELNIVCASSKLNIGFVVGDLLATPKVYNAILSRKNRTLRKHVFDTALRRQTRRPECVPFPRALARTRLAATMVLRNANPAAAS